MSQVYGSSTELAILAALQRGPLRLDQVPALLERIGVAGAHEAPTEVALHDVGASLMAEGLVATARADENEPPHAATYAMTDLGRDASRRWMRAALSARTPGPQLQAAFALLLLMPPEDGLTELEARRTAVRDEFADLQRAVDTPDRSQSAVGALEQRYRLALAVGELDWLTATIRDLHARRGVWATTST
ncbi:hypothetical protein [Actinoplanes aureus]|uniref:PadR family transcriptional regulator n=1 Tax=Actinoplanes aureus TaxID=2792083 RepID=A0A931CKC7_9ACTN|nr:hypothetical protein [Actinoplanes aureus]MBG0568656.1 hypothetical protein [Actinoplanes aureus]